MMYFIRVIVAFCFLTLVAAIPAPAPAPIDSGLKDAIALNSNMGGSYNEINAADAVNPSSENSNPDGETNNAMLTLPQPVTPIVIGIGLVAGIVL